MWRALQPVTQHLPHAASHDGGVGGHAAAGGEDALGGDHALDVFGAGLGADEDDGFAAFGPFGGFGGGEDDAADGGAGGGGEAAGDDVVRDGVVEDAVKEFGDLFGVLAAEGFGLVDASGVDVVDGDFDHGVAGAFAGAGLQDPEFALLDGELDVLHVAEVIFEGVGGAEELAVDVGL